MSWASTAPAAIAALLATLRACPDLAGTDVLDGPAVSESSAQTAVVVGWKPSDDISAEASETTEGLELSPQREQYTITCTAAARNGAGNIASARERAFALLAACGAAIAADSRLGGTVMKAAISDWSLQQVQDSMGALATITFSVSCDAYTSR